MLYAEAIATLAVWADGVGAGSKNLTNNGINNVKQSLNTYENISTIIERLTIKSQPLKCVETVLARWSKKGIAKQRLLRASFG